MMNRSTWIGVGIGALAVTAVGAVASSKYGLNPFQDYAKVVAVEPAYDVHRTSREVCNDVAVEQQVEPRDKQRVAGTVIGAVVGGVVGHQVGSGRGNDVATVAGAAAGGYAGNRIQKRMQDNNTETVVENRCATVWDSQKIPAGFDVTYEWEGRQEVVRMQEMPGERIRIEDGKPAVSES